MHLQRPRLLRLGDAERRPTDPTLRDGDIVATNEGFVAYNGGGNAATPSSRRSSCRTATAKLAHTRIEPEQRDAGPPEAMREGAAQSELTAAAAFSSTDKPATSSPIESEAVSPGDSIPNSMTSRGTP